MKELCKRIYAWTVKLLQSVVSLFSVLLFSSRKSAKSLSQLIYKEEKDSCFILGNGPSLRDMLESHMDVIKKHDCVAVNTFCNVDAFFVIRPRYYVLTDPSLFKDGVTDTRVLSIQQQVIDGLGKVDWGLTLFLPTINKKSKIIKSFANKRIRFCFYNSTPVDGFLSFQHWVFNHNLGMPVSMSVVCAAISIMIGVGYQNIFLLGVDHNMINNIYVNDNNELMIRDEHFYGEKDIRLNISVSQYTEGYCICMKTHERLAEYAKYRGVFIWNATKGSFIDAYPRRSIISA